MTQNLKLKRQYYVGLDLAKKQDFSAVAVVEQCVWTTGKKDPLTFAPLLERNTVLRHIEQIKSGTTYMRVVEHVRKMLVSEQLRDETVIFSMDATGAGEGVMEMVEAMLVQARRERTGVLNFAGVVFTAGGKTTWHQYEARVPKNTIVEGVLLAVERGELILGKDMPGVKELVAELQMMQQERSERGTRWVSAGKHDDLVMALGLALWGTTYREVPRNWRELGWGRPSWEWEAMRREEEMEKK